MNTDLLRQRRNLLIISIGLLLFDFANVTVAKISIFGSELLIGNTKVLIYFTWVMWGYFLLRYYQYLRAESDLGITSSLKSIFEGKARSHVFQKTNKQQIAGNIEFKRKGIRWEYSIKEYMPGMSELHETEKGILPLLYVAWWKVRSIFHIVAHTPKATDHVLPFILAIIAAVVSVTRVVQTHF